MKILLIHDMSRVHPELSEGLKCLGIEADLAILRNKKGNFSDLDIGEASNAPLKYFEKLFKQTQLLSNVKKYDIVQSLSGGSSFVYPLSKLFESSFFKKTNLIYVAGGSDAIYRKHVRKLKYYPPHDWYEKDNLYEKHVSRLKNVKAIIPVCWEYKFTMEQAGFKTEDLIHLPIKLNNTKSKRIRLKDDKINIYHPLNRTEGNDFKGTETIKKVFSQLQKDYGHKANFICKGQMNFDEYNKLNDQVDILVDQLNTYSYGMSAAYGMAKGQVVLSGIEDELRQQNGFKNCPVINITPDEEKLYEQIRNLVVEPELIDKIGNDSYKYAHKHHSNDKVAGKYLNIYRKVIEDSIK